MALFKVCRVPFDRLDRQTPIPDPMAVVYDRSMQLAGELGMFVDETLFDALHRLIY
jgi:hypothetical protein